MDHRIVPLIMTFMWFKAMKIMDQVVGVASAASENQINSTLNFVQFLEPSINSEKMSSKSLRLFRILLLHTATCQITFFK